MIREPPRYLPSVRELDDLDLLGSGALAPLPGFSGSDGLVTLCVPENTAKQAVDAGTLELVDPEGVPLACVTVRSTYPSGDLVGIAGDVTTYARTGFGAFRGFFLSPEDVMRRYGRSTLTVAVTVPPALSDLARIERQARWRTVVLLVLAGHGRSGELSGDCLIRATLAAARRLADVDVAAHVVAVALPGCGEAGADRRLRERVVGAYAPADVIEARGAGELPAEVSTIVGRERAGGLVLFFTGLSGSGKSTLARALHDVILERLDTTVTSLDGDVVRRNLSAGLSFSKADRETNIRRIGWVAAEISKHAGIAICSPIAPFESTRKQVRAMVEQTGGTFVLIHVATPAAECERRDRKGLYAKARAGEIAEFTGVSSPYEEPSDAEIRVDTTGRRVDDIVTELVNFLEAAGTLEAKRVR